MQSPSYYIFFLTTPSPISVNVICDCPLKDTNQISGAYSEWNDEETDVDDKCPSASYKFAFVYLVCYWVLMPLMCCLSCCCVSAVGALACCAGKRRGDVEAA